LGKVAALSREANSEFWNANESDNANPKTREIESDEGATFLNREGIERLAALPRDLRNCVRRGTATHEVGAQNRSLVRQNP